MLSVGIHNNLIIESVSIDDKLDNCLNIVYKTVEDDNPLASLDAATDTSASEGNSSTIKLFAPKVTNFNGELDTFDVNLRKIKEVKDQLHHILKNFIRESDIKWRTTEGIDGLTIENTNEMIQKQATLDKMFNNLANQFIKQITPRLPEQQPFRQLFIRQSRAKHFPTLRKRYLNTQPFMEPMAVPEEQSQLRFTQYEIDNKLDRPDKMEEDVPAAKEAQDAAEFFKS